MKGFKIKLATTKKREERKQQCDGCFAKTKWNICSGCGCWLPAKRMLEQSTCPFDFWKK